MIDGEANRLATALVQLMESDEPLGRAHAIMKTALSADWPEVTQAFVKLGWQDNNKDVPERGERLQDWLVHLRDEP